MKRLALSALLLLLPVPAFGQQRPSDCAAPAVLPADVAGWLKSRFPGWRIKSTEDLEAYHQKLWRDNRPNACPGIASGDFVEPGEKAFALLLVPEVPSNTGYKVVAVAKPHGKTAAVSAVIEDGKDQISERVVIYVVRPGLFKDAENTRRVRIQRDGIVVEAMEAGASLYFWRNAHFEHLVISE